MHCSAWLVIIICGKSSMMHSRNNGVLAERAGGVVPAVHTLFITSLSLNTLITATIVISLACHMLKSIMG